MGCEHREFVGEYEINTELVDDELAAMGEKKATRARAVILLVAGRATLKLSYLEPGEGWLNVEVRDGFAVGYLIVGRQFKVTSIGSCDPLDPGDPDDGFFVRFKNGKPYPISLKAYGSGTKNALDPPDAGSEAARNPASVARPRVVDGAHRATSIRSVLGAGYLLREVSRRDEGAWSAPRAATPGRCLGDAGRRLAPEAFAPFVTLVFRGATGTSISPFDGSLGAIQSVERRVQRAGVGVTTTAVVRAPPERRRGLAWDPAWLRAIYFATVRALGKTLFASHIYRVATDRQGITLGRRIRLRALANVQRRFVADPSATLAKATTDVSISDVGDRLLVGPIGIRGRAFTGQLGARATPPSWKRDRLDILPLDADSESAVALKVRRLAVEIWLHQHGDATCANLR